MNSNLNKKLRESPALILLSFTFEFLILIAEIVRRVMEIYERNVDFGWPLSKVIERQAEWVCDAFLCPFQYIFYIGLSKGGPVGDPNLSDILCFLPIMAFFVLALTLVVKTRFTKSWPMIYILSHAIFIGYVIFVIRISNVTNL